MPRDPLGWLDEELDSLSVRSLRRHLVARQGPQRPGSIALGDSNLINFSSNDYLGLAAECLTPAVRDCLSKTGWGAGASPLVTGRASGHAMLEQELAEFEQTEAALLFPTGFAANCSTIAALVGRGDVIFSDAKNHASIVDGCRLSGARIVIYPHCDVSALDGLMRQPADSRRRLIVTDTLFSMDGDLAPVGELAELASRYDAMLMIDEAHATGVFGSAGRGVCEHLGVEDGVHVRVGTLSKALGSMGGFVVGQQRLIDWLANRARAYVFSTAAPEAIAEAGRQALRLVRQEPKRRQTLLRRAAEIRECLQKQGWNTGKSESQIIPIILNDAKRTMEHAAHLRERGLLIPGIRPPSVPEGQSLLRISLSYGHTEEQIARLLDCMLAISLS